MPVYNIQLSVDGIDSVLREIEALRSKMNTVAEQVVRSLANDAETEMNSRLNAVVDPDGNIDASVGSNISGNEATVSLEGSQAAFLEFGTGVIGARNSHPFAGQVGWQYGAGSKYRTFKNGKVGWIYFDCSKGHYRVTSGIPAQNIVVGAAHTTRTLIARRIREALK